MAIKLTFGKVVEGDIVHRPPAIITTLSKEEEEKIIAAGNAELVEENEHGKRGKHVQRSDSE
jgi:hypothetical protein